MTKYKSKVNKWVSPISIMQTLGLIASVLTIILVFIGLVSQVIKNFKRKSCSGLSLVYFTIIFFAYSAYL